jgi:hypothetical protein
VQPRILNVANSAAEFEHLIAELFRRNGFGSIPLTRVGDIRIPDLLVATPVGMAVVEVKFFRSRRVSTRILKNICLLLDSLRREINADKAVLVTTARLAPHALGQLRAIPDLILYDFDRVAWLLAAHAELQPRFETLVRESDAFGTDDLEPRGGSADERRMFELEASELPGEPLSAKSELPKPYGHRLCTDLERLVSEQAGAPALERRDRLAKEFESTCVKAIRYLFDEDLTAWQDQATTQSRISRFDLIARIRSEGDFWKLLVTDFSTRYVVFEFKFYADRIGQGEILTTEKYLYRAALRSTAIIISPFGANDSALEMARGALREHGKLVINLSVEQLCNMLRARDGATGPDAAPADVEEELFKTLDDMLMRIER